MTPAQTIRLEALRLAITRDIANPDVGIILERARRYETFIAGEGHAVTAPSHQPAQTAHKPGHSGSHQHRHR